MAQIFDFPNKKEDSEKADKERFFLCLNMAKELLLEAEKLQKLADQYMEEAQEINNRKGPAG